MQYAEQRWIMAANFAGRLKKLVSIHSEGIKIYTRAFKTTAVETRRNKLGLRFMYKLKSNTSYINTLNTLDKREDQNYKEK